MGFTKLDERILQSSIMAESPITFKVWIALLAACRENGIAYISSVYLSSICHLPLAKVDDALERLLRPDERSRSLADEGRRIRRVDGGYEIINYAIYRDISLRDAEAERKRLYRQRHKACPDTSGRSPDPSASASASASASVFASWWSRYPRKIAKQDAAKAYAAAIKAGATPEDLHRALEGYLGDIKRNNTEERYVKHPATFLRSERWRDYLNITAPRDVGEVDPKRERSAAEVEYQKARAEKIAELQKVGGDPAYAKEQLARWSAEWWEKRRAA